MLRILAGTLLSGTLLSGPVAASSFLSPPAAEGHYGPSYLVIDESREVAPPVDATVTAAYGDADDPRVIAAPRYVDISASISIMVPSDAAVPAASIASVGEAPTEARADRPRQQARQSPPMVIRGGLIGDAFQSSAPADAPASGQPAERAASRPPPASSPSSPPSRGAASPPDTSPPSQRYDTPAAAPTGVPL